MSLHKNTTKLLIICEMTKYFLYFVPPFLFATSQADSLRTSILPAKHSHAPHKEKSTATLNELQCFQKYV